MKKMLSVAALAAAATALRTHGVVVQPLRAAAAFAVLSMILIE